MSTPNNLEALVQRLRDAAETLDADQPPLAPPIGDWHRRLAELRDHMGEKALLPETEREALACLAQPARESSEQLAEPGVSQRHRLMAPPCISVLMAGHLDSVSFVEELYQRLMGREGDPDGTAYYCRQMLRHGRLYVLGEFLQSPEASEALTRQPQEVATELNDIRDTWHRYHRGRVLGRLKPRCLDLAWRLRTALCRSRWRQEALDIRLQESRWRQEALDIRLQESRWRQEALEAWQQAYSVVANTLLQVDDVLRTTLPAWHAERHQLASAVLEMDERQRHLGHRQDHEYARQQALWQQFAAWRRAVAPAASPTQAADTDTDSDDAAAARPLAAAPAELDAYYLAFEAAFRGPEADIAAHLDHYRDAWTQARQAGAHALDLGCGRGEWLRLLTQAGFNPRGIDLNATMVTHCREQGFDVAQQDALAALGECADGSLALISGFHIAEHLPFEALFQLVSEAHRVLAPGGVLILETPNPENLIVASYSFYHDLTHRNPLTPPTLQFLLQFHGFGGAAIRRFNPPPAETRVPGEGSAVERLNALLTAPMDYAVVGRKAPDDEVAT